MRYKALLVIILCCVFLNGCSQPAIYTKTKIESTIYDEKLIELDGQKELNLTCDYGSIEIYNWDRQEIKFEMKKRVRGTQEKSKLDDKLKDFNISFDDKEGSITFKSQYKGDIKGVDDKILDLRIYIPKKINKISLQMEKGYFKLLDDMKCILNIDANTAIIEAGRIIGSVNFNIGTGNVKINNGLITGDSEIIMETGNIYVKSDYEKNIKCLYETKTGNVDLYMPSDLNPGLELYGTVDVNEFSDFKTDKNFTIRSSIGKISLKKYN